MYNDDEDGPKEYGGLCCSLTVLISADSDVSECDWLGTKVWGAQLMF